MRQCFQSKYLSTKKKYFAFACVYRSYRYVRHFDIRCAFKIISFWYILYTQWAQRGLGPGCLAYQPIIKPTKPSGSMIECKHYIKCIQLVFAKQTQAKQSILSEAITLPCPMSNLIHMKRRALRYSFLCIGIFILKRKYNFDFYSVSVYIASLGDFDIALR